MGAGIPRSKWERGLCAGRTAARVGGKALAFLARSPFRTPSERDEARKVLGRETGAVLFQGLGLLRGTALKAAQLLCLEIDILPREFAQELQKACHQAPPINRALARKIVRNALGAQPEEVFQSFDGQAFAAASLGQVHRAVARDGRDLAVKIQYPGIRETIVSDLQLLRAAAVAVPERRLLAPVFKEIEARLLEEIDYRREREHMAFFRAKLGMHRVLVPECREDLSAGTVLAAEFLEGLPLNDWLLGRPSREARDRVAQTLQDLFVAGLYRLHCIHADPNPGNFLVRDDLRVGLVDFGCVKRFDPRFVALYGKMTKTAMHGSKQEYLSLLADMGMSGPRPDPEVEERLFGVLRATGRWLARLFREECFDFGKNPDFIASGKRLMLASLELRAHMEVNPDLIFLHRTRYGLMRLFERMGARVRFRNPHECLE